MKDGLGYRREGLLLRLFGSLSSPRDNEKPLERSDGYKPLKAALFALWRAEVWAGGIRSVSDRDPPTIEMESRGR